MCVQFFNVMACGAVGDNSQDDTAAIQTAINAAVVPGVGSSVNQADFNYAVGKFSITVVRMEGGNPTPPNGNRFFQTGPIVAALGVTIQARFSDVTLAAYRVSTDNNGVLCVSGNAQVEIDNLYAYLPSGGTFGSNFLTNTGTSEGNGSIDIHHSIITATYPFWTLQNHWNAHARQVNLTNPDGSPNYVVNVDYLPLKTLTDAATVNIDLSLGTRFLLPMTAVVGTARALIITKASPGQGFTLLLEQPASGGPCSVTWFSSSIRWQGGSPLTRSIGASKIDQIEFNVCSSGSYFDTVMLGY